MNLERHRSPAEAFIEASRSAIDSRIRSSPDAVVELFNISIVERAEERPAGEDCHQYVFGRPGTGEVYQEMFGTHREIDICKEPRQPGDIVLYDDGEGVIHVGVVSSNGRDVVSKWGPDGHVYRHAPLMVPHAFGNNLRLFRRKE